MLKTKGLFKRFICYIIVLALFISSVPWYSASASESANTSLDKLQEVASEVVGDQKEYAEEAVLDALSSNIGSDWGQAIFKDFLSWNYFHNAVQAHVVSHVAEMTDAELPIALKVNIKRRMG